MAPDSDLWAPLREDLARLPPRGDAALLLRHSVRGEIRPGEGGDEVRLTPAGKRLAAALGSELGPWVGALYSSPVPRCLQTLRALRRGAGRPELALRRRKALGVVGLFVAEPHHAWHSYRSLGVEPLVRAVAAGEAVPGFAHGPSASARLLRLLQASVLPGQGLAVHCSHDYLIAIFVASLWGLPAERLAWPDFLSGALVYRAAGRWILAYRGEARPLPSALSAASGPRPSPRLDLAAPGDVP